MIKNYKYLLVMVLLILLVGCGADQADQVDQATPPEDIATANSEEKNTEYPEISSLFLGINDNWEIKYHNRQNRLEVVLVADELTADTAPEDWAETLSALADGLTAAQASADAEAFDMISVQLETSDGKILASGYNGKIQFDKFTANTTYQEVGTGLITLSIFNKIESGMTYGDVRDLIGSEGELLSTVDIGDYQYKTDTYSWDGEGSFGANAIIMFQGGRVTSKSQFGLE